MDPAQIVEWFVLRWQLEVTFQEVRAHLGVETQRQWSDRAIARTTPILMGLFSWICLGRSRIAGTPLDHPANCRLVRQANAHLRRCHSLGAPLPLDRIAQFFNLIPGSWTLYKVG